MNAESLPFLNGDHNSESASTLDHGLTHADYIIRVNVKDFFLIDEPLVQHVRSLVRENLVRYLLLVRFSQTRPT